MHHHNWNCAKYSGSILLALTAMFTSGCASSGSAPGASQSRSAAVEHDTRPILASSATLTVRGMGCPLCANNIDRQLLKVNGVQRVQVDLGSGKVFVQFKTTNTPTRDQLGQAIVRSGYTLVRIEDGGQSPSAAIEP